MKTFVISLGGSIIFPDEVDLKFLALFKKSICKFLDDNKNTRLILVTGGGAPARRFQNILRSVNPDVSLESLDWIGIRATYVNAEIVRTLFDVKDVVVTNPKADKIDFSGRILVAGGWKPGFSTDTDAVYLADRFGSNKVLNLSNTDGVYTADPRKDKNAKYIPELLWKDFLALVGDKWIPGLNAPFDPIASTFAHKNDIDVICADGHDIDNTIAIISGGKFKGTILHN